jgi:O-antigen ligase
LGWILVLPFVFFAAHGAFSFQSAGYVAERGMPGVVELRARGLIGQVLLPGVAYSVVIWLLWGSRRLIVSWAKQFRMLTLLALLTVMSAIWSQDPMRSALFGLFYLFGTLFAYYLAIRFDAEDIIALVMRTGTVVFIACMILVLFYPGFGIMHNDPRVASSWQGMFIGPTSAAKCSVFLLSPALISKSARPGRRVAYIMAMGLMIFRTHAVTAIFAVIAYILFIAMLRISRRLDRKLRVIALVASAVSVGLICVFGFEIIANVLPIFRRDLTLSGRTEIWSALTGVILQRPLLGYGYYAFWQTPSAELMNVLHATNWSFGYAHNGILEIALQLGLLGVVVFGATLLGAAGDALFCVRNDLTGRYDWFVGVIVLTLVYNMDEATVVWPNELLSILYVVACCSLARARGEFMREEERAYV